jgi:multidrug efflux pump subunit AcrB
VEVRDWIEHRLAPQLIAIHGVSSVEASGGMVREMQVVVDQERLRSYGLTMQDVIDALADENVDIAAGWITSDTFDVMGKTDGLLTSTADVENVLISLPSAGTTDTTITSGASRALRNNSSSNNPADRRIRLAEIASVYDGHQEQRLFVRLDGIPATQVSVFKLPGANTVAVVDEINATIDHLERSGFFPEDIRYTAIDDQAFFIRGAIASVTTAAILGGVLAMTVVLLFLGSIRKAFVIGLSIPIAIMATFAMMGIGNLTLNVISLGGLALGVGLLLDNAIVMLENIYRHREQLGKSPEASAHDGAAEVASAITAGTLTNLAAVAPFLLITGLAAMIFRELILTISFAILATLAAALTLVPMLAALFGHVRFESKLHRTPPLRLWNWGVIQLQRMYGGVLPWVLKLRWAAVALAAAAMVGAFQLVDDLGNEFLPQVDDGNVGVRMVLPPGTPPHETDAAARQIERTVREMDHVRTMFTMVGGHLGGGIINERPGTSNIRVQLTPADQRPEMPAGRWVAEAQERLDSLDLPGARISVRPPSIRGLQFGTQGADLAISVVGDDLETLHGLAREISARLQQINGLEGVEVGREDQSPLMRVVVDRDRAADLGLRVSEVGYAIRNAVNGAVPTQFMSGNREYDVRVRLPRDAVSDSETLGNLLVFRKGGSPVLLRDVARFDLGAGPAHIVRENQSRAVQVNGDVNTEVADIGTIMREVEARLADLELPEQYSMIYGGQWETIQETNRELAIVVVLAMFLVFVVLAVQYERLSNPLIILAAAPLALVGVVGILWLTETPLSAPVLIGVILLIGIVVNNAILLVEYIEIGRRQHDLPIREAIVEAGRIRLRPILMTTTTTVLGMTPLAFGLGSGAEIMQPLALCVIGGLLVSMLLTLFVIPCLYLLISSYAQSTRKLLIGA